ncbi:GHMP kinase [Ochromonadaceae sp. CCMP2298]|nr:GHMP kinase [Ochromonadaceae sp. CCMP2298]|eukprot:CAMPEP_0173252752 /NCGR_PEP_ID=MMETSP1142-20121109/20915_1 /TAXON_ID=483371 /ORGANISM="non described non described, Strain CCMP2298" /LENGTH=417 /DNA_ID=CAMNT_0014185857 /DNA_START=35 /DNA_END=1288 /DNA_ORIENTATION=+
MATAPGKAIIFGEHAVVYGTTAVAGSLSDMRIAAEISTVAGSSELVVVFEDIVEEESGKPSVVKVSFNLLRATIPLYEDPHVSERPSEEVKAALEALFAHQQSAVQHGMMSVAYLVGSLLGHLFWAPAGELEGLGLYMRVQSRGLPIGAGLGSSAAFSVAVAAAALLLQAKLAPAGAKNAQLLGTLDTLDAGHVVPSLEALGTINEWAYASEILLHGSPSGLDNTTSCFGGLVRFSRKGTEQFKTISTPALHFLLVNTRVPRSTRQLVGAVRSLHDAHPSVVLPILDSVEQISLKFLQLIDSCDAGGDEAYGQLVVQAGQLMALNHGLLCALGVGHPALTAVVEASQALGFPCKLTGAGGGGCAIILSPVPFCEDAPELGQEGEQEQALRSLVRQLREMGCDVHRSSVGGSGVFWTV